MFVYSLIAKGLWRGSCHNTYPNTGYGAILTNYPKLYPHWFLALQRLVNLLHHQLETCFPLETFFSAYFPPRIQFRAISKVLNCSRASVETGDKSLTLFGVWAHVYLSGVCWIPWCTPRVAELLSMFVQYCMQKFDIGVITGTPVSPLLSRSSEPHQRFCLLFTAKK